MGSKKEQGTKLLRQLPPHVVVGLPQPPFVASGEAASPTLLEPT
ncbi:hypothetical protein AtNW77_MTg0322611 (mitochondrion) [Arabidopsis thaliana]